VAGKLVKLCRALAAMHAARVLHRDLKGDNILVRDGDGEPVLVDFGSGYAPWGPRVTMGALAPGSPAYRGPQCARFLLEPHRLPGEKYLHTEADDLFALGVTLYVLLTGEYPFEASGEWELMRAIAQERPGVPHELNPRVPRALGELCLRLLEKEPEARLASASAVGQALEALLAEADAHWDVPLRHGGGSAPERRRAGEPAPARPVRATVGSRARWVGGVCVLLVTGLGAYALRSTPGPRRDTEPPSPTRAGPTLAALLGASPEAVLGGDACRVREVAPPWRPAEAPTGAAPSRAVHPAPVVTVTMLPEGGTHVKRDNKARDKRQERGLGAELARLCIGGAALVNAACASAPPPRPPPASQPCPPGAEEVMAHTLAIRHVSPPVNLPEANLRDTKPIPVREGPVSITLLAPWDKLPSKSVLSGRLVFGPERVLGRFTEARLPTGETLPVCFALWPDTADDRQGLRIEGSVGPDVLLVEPLGELKRVRRFE
jgi:eukaryotic-like serine/threonine-protein kinase